MDKSEIIADSNHFTRKMRLKHHFHDASDNTTQDKSTQDNAKPNMSEFGIKSQAISKIWTPKPGANKHLDEFCDSVTNHLALTPTRIDKDNLSADERTALKNFQKKY